MSFLSANPPKFGTIARRGDKLHLLDGRYRPVCRPRSVDVQLVWAPEQASEHPLVCLRCVRSVLSKMRADGRRAEGSHKCQQTSSMT